MSAWYFFLIQFSILTYAVLGGVFLAFSDFIMRALAKTHGVGGTEVMQSINREVFRWVFMVLFLGMAPISLIVSGHSALNFNSSAQVAFLLAGIVYLVGCFGVTIAFNVPMNEALAGMDLSSDATRRYWTSTYLPRWTFWNSVRSVACLASSGLLLTGLIWITQNQTR